jgi:hypothetical protein
MISLLKAIRQLADPDYFVFVFGNHGYFIIKMFLL